MAITAVDTYREIIESLKPGESINLQALTIRANAHHPLPQCIDAREALEQAGYIVTRGAKVYRVEV